MTRLTRRTTAPSQRRRLARAAGPTARRRRLRGDRSSVRLVTTGRTSALAVSPHRCAAVAVSGAVVAVAVPLAQKVQVHPPAAAYRITGRGILPAILTRSAAGLAVVARRVPTRRALCGRVHRSALVGASVGALARALAGASLLQLGSWCRPLLVGDLTPLARFDIYRRGVVFS